MPESVSYATPALGEAERLMRYGRFEMAVEVLQKVLEQEPTLQAICLLASSYLELGEHDRALHYASVAIERDPSSAPARTVLARVNVALGRYLLRAVRFRHCGRPTSQTASGTTG